MYRIAVLFSVCLFSSCLSYKPVMITGIKDMKTANVTGEKVEMSFDLEIDNPNGFKIVLNEYNMDVSFNGKTMGKAVSVGKIAIKRRSKDYYPFVINAAYDDFMAATVSGLGSLFKKEPVTFKVKGAMKGRIGWLRKTIPIETTQKIKF